MRAARVTSLLILALPTRTPYHEVMPRTGMSCCSAEPNGMNNSKYSACLLVSSLLVIYEKLYESCRAEHNQQRGQRYCRDLYHHFALQQSARRAHLLGCQ